MLFLQLYCHLCCPTTQCLHSTHYWQSDVTLQHWLCTMLQCSGCVFTPEYCVECIAFVVVQLQSITFMSET